MGLQGTWVSIIEIWQNDQSDLWLVTLVSPVTVNTVPEKTLLAFAEHGEVKRDLVLDDGNAEIVLAKFSQARVNEIALAAQLQRDGVQSFAISWNDLMEHITSKCAEFV